MQRQQQEIDAADRATFASGVAERKEAREVVDTMFLDTTTDDRDEKDGDESLDPKERALENHIKNLLDRALEECDVGRMQKELESHFRNSVQNETLMVETISLETARSGEIGPGGWNVLVNKKKGRLKVHDTFFGRGVYI